MLLSDAERELLFEQLKLHAAAGRLGVEELERRVAVVALAETREQAETALADLPPIESTASGRRALPRTPRRGRPSGARLAPDQRAFAIRVRTP